jgi:hypothetical protein
MPPILTRLSRTLCWNHDAGYKQSGLTVCLYDGTMAR